jgi:hypothetical protein
MIKIGVAIAFSLILISLASALFFLMKDKSQGRRTVRALTVRISLSIVLFLGILICYKLGLITPTGLPYTPQ